MTLFVSSLLSCLAPALAGMLLCAAIASAAIAYQVFLQRLPNNVRVQVAGLANMVTSAVEQKYLGSSPGGMLKKQEALQMLLSICHNLSLPVDEKHASAAIEAAVYAMNLYARFRPGSMEQSARTPDAMPRQDH